MDNGNNRVLDTTGTVCGQPGSGGPNVPGFTPCYSRAPIYQIDEITKTAIVLWQYNEQPVYSFWGGSVQQLDNGNAAIDFNAPSDDITGARYLEVTTDPSPQIVLKMEISGQAAYRIIHLPSLYPGVQW
jgi:hypothetical protein